MKIELYENDKLKITLGHEELLKNSMSFDSLDYNNMETRKLIWDLLEEAKRSTGFDPMKSKLLIEAVPSKNGGCVLFFTQISKSSFNKQNVLNKIYPYVPIIYKFNNFDDLLDAVRLLAGTDLSNISDSQLLSFNNKYLLIIYQSIPLYDNQKMLLNEFASKVCEDSLKCSYYLERCNVISAKNAITLIISQIFLKM